MVRKTLISAAAAASLASAALANDNTPTQPKMDAADMEKALVLSTKAHGGGFYDSQGLVMLVYFLATIGMVAVSN